MDWTLLYFLPVIPELSLDTQVIHQENSHVRFLPEVVVGVGGEGVIIATPTDLGVHSWGSSQAPQPPQAPECAAQPESEGGQERMAQMLVLSGHRVHT